MWSISILKVPIQKHLKMHAMKLSCKVYEIDSFFFYVFVYEQISIVFHISKTYNAELKTSHTKSDLP